MKLSSSILAFACSVFVLVLARPAPAQVDSPAQAYQVPGYSDAVLFHAAASPGTTSLTTNPVIGGGFIYRFTHTSPNGVETTVYRIDTSSAPVRRGLLSVYEAKSGCWPLKYGGPTYRPQQPNCSGSVPPKHPSEWLTAPSALISESASGQRLALEFAATGPTGSNVLRWKYVFSMTGRQLNVQIQAIDPVATWDDNFAGFATGRSQFAPSSSPTRIHLQGTSTIPIVMFNGSSAGEKNFVATFVDPLLSNASGISFEAVTGAFPASAPAGTPVSSIDANNTLISYEDVVQFGHIMDYKSSHEIECVPLASLEETLRVVASNTVLDCFLEPNWETSPYKPVLSERTVIRTTHVFGASGGQAGQVYTPFMSVATALNRLSSYGITDTCNFLWDKWQQCYQAGVSHYPARCTLHSEDQLCELPSCTDSCDELGWLANAVSTRHGLLGLYHSLSALNQADGASHGGACEIPPYASLSNNLDDVAKSADGTIKPDAFGDGAVSDTALLKHVEREYGWEVHGGTPPNPNQAESAYDTHMAFVDVLTYSSPDGKPTPPGQPEAFLSLDRIDQDLATDNAHTLRQACLDRKAWLGRVSELVQGPLLGEGSFSQMRTSMDYLWSGYVAGNQRGIMTGSGVLPEDLCPYETTSGCGNPEITCCEDYAALQWPGDCTALLQIGNGGNGTLSKYAPSQWHVVPDYNYRSVVPWQSNFHAPRDRFATEYELCLWNNQQQLGVDKSRLYSLTYGYVGFSEVNTGFSTLVSSPAEATKVFNQLKWNLSEYYMLNALQPIFLESPVSDVSYFVENQSGGSGMWRSLDEELKSSSDYQSALRNRVIRIRFGVTPTSYSIVMYLNHSPASWDLIPGAPGEFIDWQLDDPQELSSQVYRLPEDGFFVHAPAAGPSAFAGRSLISFSAYFTDPSHRFDYCYAPGRWEYRDGRGQGVTFGGLEPGFSRIIVNNFAEGNTIREPAPGQGVSPFFEVISNSTPMFGPMVTIEPSALVMSPGEVDRIRVLATWMDASGAALAWRDVTSAADKVCSVSGNPNYSHSITVDANGIVRGNVPYSSDIIATWAGFQSAATTVAVESETVPGLVSYYGFSRRGNHLKAKRAPWIDVELVNPPQGGTVLRVHLYNGVNSSAIPGRDADLVCGEVQRGRCIPAGTGTPMEPFVLWVEPLQVYSKDVDLSGHAVHDLPVVSGQTVHLQWVNYDNVGQIPLTAGFTAGATVHVP